MLAYYPTFNEFYVKNQNEIDGYILNRAYKFQHLMDADDMFQEITLRLLKSNVLEKWDEKKGALNTYLTHRIRGYSLHIITKKLKDEPKSKFIVRLDKFHDSSDHFSDTDFSNGYHVELETPLEEEELLAKEIIEIFKKSVSPIQAEIFELHYWGELTYHEIEVIINERYGSAHHYSYIRNKCIQATACMMNILTSEGVNCVR